MRSLRCIFHFLKGCFPSVRPPLEPVEHVDIPRYMGSWRVYAVYDNVVERHFADAVESYRHRGEGHIAVEFRYREQDLNGPLRLHRFTARVTDRPHNSRWRVRLFPLVTASYVIIALDEKYRWAAIAHPSRNFAWVIARGTTIPDTVWKDLLEVFRRQGYDPARFQKIPQPAGLEQPLSSISKTPS